MDEPEDKIDLGEDLGLVPIEQAYQLLGIENLRLYYDLAKRAIMIEARVGKALRSSKSDKSVLFAGTTRGAIPVRTIDKRAPEGLRLMVSVYILKPRGLIGMREKRAKEVLEARILRGEQG